MFKVPKQSYTTEFKVPAVQRVKNGQGFAVVTRQLGMSEQTLRHWVKAEASGKLNGAGAKPVTPEQMELSRKRAPGGTQPPFQVLDAFVDQHRDTFGVEKTRWRP